MSAQKLIDATRRRPKQTCNKPAYSFTCLARSLARSLNSNHRRLQFAGLARMSLLATQLRNIIIIGLRASRPSWPAVKSNQHQAKIANHWPHWLAALALCQHQSIGRRKAKRTKQNGRENKGSPSLTKPA